MKKIIFDVLVCLLILLFFYTGFSKYADLEFYVSSIHRQHFPPWLTQMVIWGLPPAEIITGSLLIADKTRKTGLWISVILLTVFTFYIIGILLHVFSRTPCPCGGIIRTFRWPQHLVFNIIYLAINLWAIAISGIKYRPAIKS
jgi:putative oxidoreductase